jgi:sigma-B regulation protein RsbU (phosphoserine phosphatase)
VNAGHNPPFILSANGIRQVEMTNGLALGVLDDFNFSSKTLKLNQGEKLLLYTDGVIDAFNPEEKGYGEEQFENFLNQCLDLPVETIIKNSFTEITDFVGGAPQSDDITLLGITFKT